jgi:hypothetical protein
MLHPGCRRGTISRTKAFSLKGMRISVYIETMKNAHGGSWSPGKEVERGIMMSLLIAVALILNWNMDTVGIFPR